MAVKMSVQYPACCSGVKDAVEVPSAALIQSLAWEFSYAVAAAKKKIYKNLFIFIYMYLYVYWAAPPSSTVCTLFASIHVIYKTDITVVPFLHVFI